MTLLINMLKKYQYSNSKVIQKNDFNLSQVLTAIDVNDYGKMTIDVKLTFVNGYQFTLDVISTI